MKYINEPTSQLVWAQALSPLCLPPSQPSYYPSNNMRFNPDIGCLLECPLLFNLGLGVAAKKPRPSLHRQLRRRLPVLAAGTSSYPLLLFVSFFLLRRPYLRLLCGSLLLLGLVAGWSSYPGFDAAPDLSMAVAIVLGGFPSFLSWKVTFFLCFGKVEQVFFRFAVSWVEI